MTAQQLIELALTGMAKWRVPDVVHQGQRFGQVGVQRERIGNGSRYLRNLDGVCEAIAEVVGIARRENLCLCFEAPKCARVNHTVAVTRIYIAVRMRRLRVTAGHAISGRVHCIGGEGHNLILCHLRRQAKRGRWPRSNQ